MLHPATELRFIDSVIGYGVFATQRIPKGTLTWVRDELDQTFTPERMKRFSTFHRELLDRYSFVDRHGDYVLCWDHARYINHACEATSLSPGYGFEIAVRDIEQGEELTDDYGTLNIDVPFTCCCGSAVCRKEIRPDDLVRYADGWDRLIAGVFGRISQVAQPLWELVTEKDEVARVLAGELPIASCRQNFFLPATEAQPLRSQANA
ncbi:MAG: SET domain-containing protein [Polyangiaceae bacterium]